ncbi:RibD family protein [Aquisalimonas asiatica]|uniref:Pyrimidine reductase, riboflavin biosynthesis n=1 Tax=Aquisalimonas asiatica TaxID=406100 RepID=A0A1H8QDK6_9GAMM|nr:dihydrofolate reductase family protein [Aquisalimonas asiatica]SEO52136.1 Pyrimidine reductase, riboflavin biosynthesis [Aquisalimonas asiatica]
MTDTGEQPAPVHPLYPDAGSPVPLQRLYLEAPLPDQGRFGPWIYGNFVATLDGRIALAHPETGRLGVTESIGDARDWRLFQELAARADVLITSGRYLRDLRLGTAQDVLPLSSREPFADLLEWRVRHGYPRQPDVAVLSATLDFQLPEALFRQGRRVTVLTGALAGDEAVQRHEQDGARVIRVSSGDAVDGGDVARALGDMGYRRAYSVTGPYVLHALMRAGALDGLFLTQRHRIVGGEHYSTITEGPVLTPPADLRLQWLYLDAATETAPGQQFARFSLEYRPS